MTVEDPDGISKSPDEISETPNKIPETTTGISKSTSEIPPEISKTPPEILTEISREISQPREWARMKCGCVVNLTDDEHYLTTACGRHQSGVIKLEGEETEELGAGRSIERALDNELDWRVRNASRRRDVQDARKR